MEMNERDLLLTLADTDRKLANAVALGHAWKQLQRQAEAAEELKSAIGYAIRGRCLLRTDRRR